MIVISDLTVSTFRHHDSCGPYLVSRLFPLKQNLSFGPQGIQGCKKLSSIPSLSPSNIFPFTTSYVVPATEFCARLTLYHCPCLVAAWTRGQKISIFKFAEQLGPAFYLNLVRQVSRPPTLGIVTRFPRSSRIKGDLCELDLPRDDYCLNGFLSLFSSSVVVSDVLSIL